MKRLYRSRTEKMLAGVCGGIGDYFEIDPTMIRLAWILFGFIGGSGIIAYIIAAIVIPHMPISYTQPGPEGTWQVGGDQNRQEPRDAQYASYQQSSAQGQTYQQGQQTQTNQQGQTYQQTGPQTQTNQQSQPYYGQQQPNGQQTSQQQSQPPQ